MIIQKSEVYISENIKKDNSVDNVEIAEKIVNKRVIAMRRRMDKMLNDYMMRSKDNVEDIYDGYY